VFGKETKKAEKMKKEHEKEKEELIKEIGQLTVEVNWLKKNLASSKNRSERKELIERKDNEITIKKQCELLSVSRSVFYYRGKEVSEYELTIKREIDIIHTEIPFYGSRKITQLLKNRGYNINRKRIVRYMRQMNIRVIHPKPNLSKRNLKHRTYPYLLGNFTPQRTNEVWGIDITYISMPKGHMYLFNIIDWYSRKVIGYTLSNTLETEFVLRGLEKAFSIYGTPKIINSDQGSQFTSNDYIQLLKAHKIQISMDSKGRATDNAIAERFFRNLKKECLYIMEYSTVNELKKLVRN